MEIEKQEYIHIKMHISEAEKLIMLLEQVDSGQSNLPDWAKAQALEFQRKLKAAGA